MTPNHEFEEITDQMPDLADLGRNRPRDTSIPAILLNYLAIIAFGGGGILALAFSSWKLAVGGVVAFVTLMMLAGAVNRHR